MNDVIKKLEKMGCDIDGAMERFLNDEEMYMNYLPIVLNDNAFHELKRALIANDADRAYDAAHSLKGILSQMGIKSIYNITVDMIELLKNGETTGLSGMYDRLIKERNMYLELIK